MKIETGKSYITRDGQHTGPLTNDPPGPKSKFTFWSRKLSYSYNEDGRWCGLFKTDYDIVEEVLYPFSNTIDSPLPSNAEDRKAIPIYYGFLKYFPRAIVEVTKLSAQGNVQHGIGDGSVPVWDRSKSPDEKDALLRHMIDEDWVAVAWRAMANLEKELEQQANL